MGEGRRDLVASLGPLGAGHFFAMAGILGPFAVMTALVAWQREIRVGAGLLVIAAGVYLLVARGHPRFPARTRRCPGKNSLDTNRPIQVLGSFVPIRTFVVE